MSKRKKVYIFFVAAFLLASLKSGISEASTTIGKTEVGVGFVKGSDSSSSSSSTNTEPSTSHTQDSSSSSTSSDSQSESNNLHREIPKDGNGTGGNTPVSAGANKMLPTTGEKSTSLWIIVGILVLLMAFVLNRLYERKKYE
ncbi:LPXTG cell wall anchor domain-containing protein [Candidatus Enterococcus murrayae]|uniref:LPXTG cell wall anchor domain-containing protein n=1 Tax=Candidatus Enterococcus murrayae TaxID=2815321 RepID=A0ABS3HGT5_9ENTE|nr:LPXTG cell wall anchor domain-containing protein [Enterococcus sp. MJM16]MBO0452668.1 LPXTG cell wall anchor domain-containing protein [Enterococcus sp. MJM16]